MIEVVGSGDSEEYERRLAVVQEAMRADGLDFLVSIDTGGWLPPTGDARYLTGFTFTNLAPAFTGVAVVVPVASEPVLVTPAGPQGQFADWAGRVARTARVQTANSFVEGIVRTIQELGVGKGRVGIGQGADVLARLGELLPGWEMVDVCVSDSTATARGPLERARASKSEHEIGLLAAAQTAADLGLIAFKSALLPGTRNVVVQAAAHLEAVRAGAEDALVIMNSGTDPWVWWHYQGDRTVSLDEIASAEVNARVSGYTAQLARSGMVGRADGPGHRLLEAGEASVAAMVASLRPGATGHDIWRAGMEALRKAGVESWGRLGHGMGLAMDEGIAVVEGDQTPLEVGTVIAVHAAPWDSENRRSALIGEQYVIRDSGAELLSGTVPARAWTLIGTTVEGVR